jgi:hypothetical protein
MVLLPDVAAADQYHEQGHDCDFDGEGEADDTGPDELCAATSGEDRDSE